MNLVGPCCDTALVSPPGTSCSGWMNDVGRCESLCWVVCPWRSSLEPAVAASQGPRKPGCQGADEPIGCDIKCDGCRCNWVVRLSLPLPPIRHLFDSAETKEAASVLS
jgi:hypothetical protein